MRRHFISLLISCIWIFGKFSESCQTEQSYIQSCLSPISQCFHCLPCWNDNDAFIDVQNNNTMMICDRQNTCSECVTKCKVLRTSTCPEAQIVKSRLKKSTRVTVTQGGNITRTLDCSQQTNTSIQVLWALYHKSNLPDKGTQVGVDCAADRLGELVTACNAKQKCSYEFVYDRNCVIGAYEYQYGYYCTPYSNGQFPPVQTTSGSTSSSDWWTSSAAIVTLVLVFIGGAPIWCCCLWMILKRNETSRNTFEKWNPCFRDYTVTSMDEATEGENYRNNLMGSEPRESGSRLVQGIGFENKIEPPDGYPTGAPLGGYGIYMGGDDVKTNNSLPKEENSMSYPVNQMPDLHDEHRYDLGAIQVGTSMAANQQLPWQHIHGAAPVFGAGPIHGAGPTQGYAPNMTYLGGENPNFIDPNEIQPTPRIDGVQKIDTNDLQFVMVIGQGSYGKVFRARWQGLVVAAKKFHRDNVDEEKVGDFIRHEIELSSKASGHPNVLTVYGYCVDPFCLVTELMDFSVKKYLDFENGEGKSAPVVKRAKFALQAARGIAHLHSLKIVHRDIAARNILVSNVDNEEEMSVVVSDFGMSRIMNQEAYAQTYSAVGPLKWMAPEAIKEQKFSIKSDTFAFGITLWEILTGKEPYVGLDAVNTAVEVLVRDSRPAINPTTPTALTELMKSCWQAAPDNRPDFPEIIKRLEDFIDAGSSR